MPPEVLEGIFAVTAMLGLGGMVLVGMKLRYNYKASLNQGDGGSEEVRRLSDAVDHALDEIQNLREGMVELQERVEFTERALTSGRSAGPPEHNQP